MVLSVLLELGKSACRSLGSAVSPHAVNMVVSCFGFSGNVESLREKSKRLTDIASDVEKAVNDLEKRRKVRKTEVASWFHDVTKTNLDFVNLEIDLLVEQNKFMNPLLRGGQVLKLISRFDKLLQQHKDFCGLLVLDAYETWGNPLSTTKLSGEAFEKYVKKIWKCVVNDKIPIVGIYGMGGVGKTTLAKRIHDLLLKEPTFHAGWITVSQQFDISKLQDDIAKAIGLDLSTENDDQVKRVASLKEALSRKNDFVLILDDVWDSTSLIEGGITHHLDGCRLIITTRSLDICHQISCDENVLVQTLSEDEAWNLFRDTLGPRTPLTPQVEKIAKAVTKECDGLPLGIVVLAGSMRGVTDIHVWKNTLTELKESLLGQDDNFVMKEKVFKVLKYSFDRLDPRYTSQGKIRNGYTKLQLCFLYCSLYPEDSLIEKESLISRFISEKLIDHRESRGEEIDKGHDILDKLVKACLLESIAGIVKMHDLVRDMALEITRDNPKFKVLAGRSLKVFPSEEENWTMDLEKMSLMNNYIREIPQGMSPNCPKLSTLLLNWNSKLAIIPVSFFSLMRGLSVLDLSCTSITVLPNSVCDLESLNMLDLSYCYELVHVGNLGKLKALKELYLNDCYNIREVPQGLENLVNLKILSLLNVGIKMLPIGLLPKLQHLQCLFLPYYVHVVVEEIESLKQLEKVSCGVKDVYDFNLFVRSQQSGQGNITSYHIVIGYSVDAGKEYADLELSYKRVKVYRCNLEKEGEGNEVTLLGQDIQVLELRECEGLSSCFSDDLQQRWGNPRSIHTLELRECKGIECIARVTTTQQEELNSLEKIKLYYMPDLMGLVVGDATAIALTTGLFSSLKLLRIHGCHKMKKLGLLDLQNLETMHIRECNEIEEIIQVVAEQGREGVVLLPKLKELELTNLPKLKSIIQVVAGEGRGCVVSLPKLKTLELMDLPKLKSICTNEEAKMCCNSIEEITIGGCPEVKKPPLVLLRSSSVEEDGGHQYHSSSYSSPPNLRRIIIDRKKWWESLEWDDPTHKDILLPFCRFYYQDDDDNN